MLNTLLEDLVLNNGQLEEERPDVVADPR